MAVWFVLLLVAPWGVMGRPDGAPRSSCSSLTPAHSGFSPQNKEAPYSVSIVHLNDRVRVTISSPIGEDFQGFALQARSARDRKRMVEGKFTARNGVSKTIDCFRGKQNTLTQSNTDAKSQIVTEWVPSDGEKQDVIFRATVVKTYDKFWTEIDSPPVTVGNTKGLPTSNPSKQKDESDSTGYGNCFVSKGCFGYPTGCIPNEDCEVLLSFSSSADGVAFKIRGFLEPENYMAMALSLDQAMGDDGVMECFRQGSEVTMRESWNEGQKNVRTREFPRSAYTSGVTDGLTTCEWTSSNLIEANGRIFNLSNSTYYLLLAKGPLRNGRLSYHSGRIYTQEKVNFTSFEAIEGEGIHDAIKIHGTFMVTAWVGLVSVAILLARHFKGAWEARTLCGVNVWFALHRGLMIVALLFVVIAFIVIFIYKDGWNYETKNPHAILGCIATAFGLFQPLMAAFRPAPDHPKRPIFNWLHWTFGNGAQVIAVIALFFAVSLDTSGLKDSFYWVLTIFVIVYLIFHSLFQIHAWTAGKKKKTMK